MERSASHRLGAEETQAVLRRAAELDRDHAAAAAGPAVLASDEEVGLDAEDLEKIAAESGLSREAVRRAVAELRGGRFDKKEPPRGVQRLVAGEPTEAELSIAAPPHSAERNLTALLANRGLEPVKRGPDATRWEPKLGLRASLGRVANLGGNGAFIGSTVESSVWAAPGGGSRVALRGEAGNLMASIATIAGLLLAFPAGIAMLVVLALGARWGFGGQHALAFLMVAVAWAGLTTLIARGVARKRVRKLRRSLERALEELAANAGPMRAH